MIERKGKAAKPRESTLPSVFFQLRKVGLGISVGDAFFKMGPSTSSHPLQGYGGQAGQDARKEARIFGLIKNAGVVFVLRGLLVQNLSECLNSAVTIRCPI